MNKQNLTCIGAIGAMILAPAHSQAGLLAPPPGSVAPTPGPEPRTPVSAETTPGDGNSTFRISQSGSYYLTSTLVGEVGKHGIEISTRDVTLDLNGFTLEGVAGSLDGIVATNEHIHVLNGIVRNWDGDGVDISFSNGSSVWRVGAHHNAGHGIRLLNSSRIIDCHANNNDLNGFVAGTGTVVTGCAARDNAGHGFEAFNSAIISGCTSVSNDQDGFSMVTVGILWNCLAESNLNTGIRGVDRVSLFGCVSANNPNGGIALGNECSVVQCTTVNNIGAGIEVGDGCSVLSCLSGSNIGDNVSKVGDGVRAGSACHIEQNHTRNNENEEIDLVSQCWLKENFCISSSITAGTSSVLATGFANVIDGNVFRGSGSGTDLRVTPGAWNFIVRNFFEGSTLGSTGDIAIIGSLNHHGQFYRPENTQGDLQGGLLFSGVPSPWGNWTTRFP